REPPSGLTAMCSSFRQILGGAANPPSRQQRDDGGNVGAFPSNGGFQGHAAVAPPQYIDRAPKARTHTPSSHHILPIRKQAASCAPQSPSARPSNTPDGQATPVRRSDRCNPTPA